MTTKKSNGERLAIMETKIDSMQEDIKEIKNSLKAHVAWEEGKYETMKNDFAAKWTERATWAILAAIIGIAITIIFGG